MKNINKNLHHNFNSQGLVKILAVKTFQNKCKQRKYKNYNTTYS